MMIHEDDDGGGDDDNADEDCVLRETLSSYIPTHCSYIGLDSDGFQQKLVAAGACETVTKALLKYSCFETLAHACFRALVVLLVNNIAYQTKLGAAGVCACIVESMHMYPYSALVAKWGCRAASVLAEKHESNIAKLGMMNHAPFPGCDASYLHHQHHLLLYIYPSIYLSICALITYLSMHASIHTGAAGACYSIPVSACHAMLYYTILYYTIPMISSQYPYLPIYVLHRSISSCLHMIVSTGDSTSTSQQSLRRECGL